MPRSISSPRRSRSWALVASVVLAGVGIGAVAHRLTPAPAESIDDGSGLRAVPANRMLEPGALMNLSPETTTTTIALPETTAPVTTVDRATRKRTSAGLPPLAPASINARVSAFGDSVMLEAKPALAAVVSDLSLDAVIGRQAGGTLDAVRAFHDAGRLGDEIVVQVGNNGSVTNDEFDEIMSLLSGASRVLVVNVKVDREWEGPNNDLLAAGVARWPNAVLVDWYSLASTDPDGLLSDGVHLQPAGIDLYTRLILSGL